MKIENSKGKIYYGMHFYPGVAEYQEPGKEAYRVYLNEATIRSMDPTFAGRPIYIDHVDQVSSNLEELKTEADGWVIESFYNKSDGKHWVKFIVVSDAGERAIRDGLRLSNAYVPKSFKDGGLWNGVTYTKEITGGEYEHLAIVKNPRYEESVIMTPDEFKQYNENHNLELERLSNSKEGERPMAFNLFKRTKVENSADFEGMHVILPKSKKEMSISELIEGMDKVVNMAGYAADDHMVKVGNEEMSVSDLAKKHIAMNAEMEELKKPKNESEMEEDVKPEATEVNVESDMANADEDEEEKMKAKKNSDDLAKKEAAKKKADAIRNANKAAPRLATVELMQDQVVRGKARYGSN